MSDFNYAREYGLAQDYLAAMRDQYDRIAADPIAHAKEMHRLHGGLNSLMPADFFEASARDRLAKKKAMCAGLQAAIEAKKPLDAEEAAWLAHERTPAGIEERKAAKYRARQRMREAGFDC